MKKFQTLPKKSQPLPKNSKPLPKNSQPPLKNFSTPLENLSTHPPENFSTPSPRKFLNPPPPPPKKKVELTPLPHLFSIFLFFFLPLFTFQKKSKKIFLGGLNPLNPPPPPLNTPLPFLVRFYAYIFGGPFQSDSTHRSEALLGQILRIIIFGDLFQSDSTLRSEALLGQILRINICRPFSVRFNA